MLDPGSAETALGMRFDRQRLGSGAPVPAVWGSTTVVGIGHQCPMDATVGQRNERRMDTAHACTGTDIAERPTIR